MTRTQATALVMELRAHYAQKVPDETIIVYAGHLEAYEYTDASLGLRRLVEAETSPYFPPWAVVQRYVGETSAGAFPTADQAWDTLQRAIRKHGAYEAPPLHPLIAATVDTNGGWVAACHAPEGDQWVRKTFVDTYEVLAARAARTGHLPTAELRGIFGNTGRDELPAEIRLVKELE